MPPKGFSVRLCTMVPHERGWRELLPLRSTRIWRNHGRRGFCGKLRRRRQRRMHGYTAKLVPDVDRPSDGRGMKWALFGVRPFNRPIIHASPPHSEWLGRRPSSPSSKDSPWLPLPHLTTVFDKVSIPDRSTIDPPPGPNSLWSNPTLKLGEDTAKQIFRLLQSSSLPGATNHLSPVRKNPSLRCWLRAITPLWIVRPPSVCFPHIFWRWTWYERGRRGGRDRICRKAASVAELQVFLSSSQGRKRSWWWVGLGDVF